MKNKERRSRHRITVDSRGIWCPPTPLTDLFRAWRKSEIGDEVELLATEPTIEDDVRAWAKKSGNMVLEVNKEKDYTRLVIRFTKKGKEVGELSAKKTNMKEPDETKTAPKMVLQVATVGGSTLGLRTLEPGWRWSESAKPMAKTNLCEVRHVGYVVSGRMEFTMFDGVELEVGPGDAFEVLPGHDAWVVGNEPAVFLELIGRRRRPAALSKK